jgi:HK97 family phage prohead protease
MAALYASERKAMGDSFRAQVTVKAVATAVEHGSFTAIAAAYTIDRDNEFIRPGAFEKTIAAWRSRGSLLPLHWAHKGEPENIIGAVDPGTMEEVDDGLYVEGKLDLEESTTAKEAWRLVKSGTVGLSFGFLGTVGPERKDGTREIVEIDLFEVSLTPAPANPDTKILSWKSVDPPPDPEELRKQSQQIQRDLVERQLPEVEAPEVPPEDPPEVVELKAQVETLEQRLAEAMAEPEKTQEELRKESEEIQRGLIAKDLPEPAKPNAEREVHKIKRLTSELRSQLEEAGSRRFGADKDTWVYVEDFDVSEKYVIFCVSSSDPYRERYVKVAFAQGETETVLADEELEVERITQFRPKGSVPEAKAGPDPTVQKAEETDRGRRSVRSVDPLRRASQRADLERLFDGAPPAKPPNRDPDPEPLDVRELRKASRNAMLELLTGAIHDKE